MEQKLMRIFERYAAFGAGSSNGPGPRTLDGARFAKIFRDAKLLDTKFTTITVDIVFAKVKNKTERKITFPQFLQGVELLAKQKYPSDPGSFNTFANAVIATIEAQGGPSVAGATAANTNSGIYAKLTDSSLYTGFHKDKFSELEAAGKTSPSSPRSPGRVAVAAARNRTGEPVKNLSQITRTNLSVGPTSFHT